MTTVSHRPSLSLATFVAVVLGCLVFVVHGIIMASAAITSVSTELDPASWAALTSSSSENRTIQDTSASLQSLSTRQIQGLSGESFSACLMVMDENHRLPEWLAFHAFVLPLRELIVVVDPRSKTSPNEILEKWRLLVNITIWSDADFGFRRKWQKAKTPDELLEIHLDRQKAFFAACSKFLKQRNRTWTVYQDSDEYLTIDGGRAKDWHERLQQPGSVLRLLKDVRSNHPNMTHYQFDCITIPRTRFTAKESSTKEVERGVPTFLDARKFDTLRYRYRTRRARKQSNGAAKSIANVEHAPRWTIYGIHRVFKRFCAPLDITRGVFGIHHYSSSPENFLCRDDPRGLADRTAMVNGFARVKTKPDDEIRPWIQGFVNWAGEPLARYLLQDVGRGCEVQRS